MQHIVDSAPANIQLKLDAQDKKQESSMQDENPESAVANKEETKETEKETEKEDPQKERKKKGGLDKESKLKRDSMSAEVDELRKGNQKFGLSSKARQLKRIRSEKNNHRSKSKGRTAKLKFDWK